MLPRFLRAVVNSALAASLLWGAPSEVTAQTCEGSSPANQVPAAYWPAELEPALNGLQLPARRDSTTFATTTAPGYASGHELYVGVATVPGILVAAYNAGLQIWDISAGKQELPQAEPIAFRDGWMNGHFLYFPGFGEVDSYGNAVTVYQEGTTTYIAYSARDEAGLSLWKLNTNPPISSTSLTQIYQDPNYWAYEARFAKIGSTLYAFVAVDGGGGVAVYDVSRANALGSCLEYNPDVNSPAHNCSNVYKGRLGTTSLGKYLDTLELDSGNVLISSSAGSTAGVEIWEVGANLELPIRRFSGLSTRVHGTSLFEKGGDTYLAVVEQVLGTGGEVNIYDIDACIGSNCSLGAPVWTSRGFDFNGIPQFLTYSESAGVPYLHYGLRNSNMGGAENDFLADLSTLGTTNQVSYLTDTGATFLDDCSNEQVGYFGWYYPFNDDGLTFFAPIQGRFEGNYFYRANWSTLDVHVRGGGGGTPMITATATSPAPFWMDEPLDFSAVRTSCAGTGTWSWSHGDSLSATVVNNGDTSQIKYSLCATTDCGDRPVSVTAAHSACAGATLNSADITLIEPRAQIRSLDIAPPANPQTYPVCSQLSFSAVVDGRDDPMTYLWEVRDSVTDELMHIGTGTTLDWDTSAVIVALGPDIFTDGFESGDTTGWNYTGSDPLTTPSTQSFQGHSSYASPTLLALVEGILAARDFDIDLTVTNRGGAWVTQSSEPFTLTEIGDLALANPAITAFDFGGGQFEFTAQGTNATLWRWEIEDPENGTEACTLFSGMCQILDYGIEDSVLPFQWAPPNVPGTYQIGVSIKNCTLEAPVSGVISVVVDEIVLPEPLEMTSFEIHADSIDPGNPNRPCNWNPIFSEMKCKISTAITFAAVATGSPSHIGVDWEGDGTFEQSFAVGAAIVHAYSSLGARTPKARAQLGSSSSAGIAVTFGGNAIEILVVTSF